MGNLAPKWLHVLIELSEDSYFVVLNKFMLRCLPTCYRVSLFVVTQRFLGLVLRSQRQSAGTPPPEWGHKSKVLDTAI